MTTVVYDGETLAADTQSTSKSDGTLCGRCGEDSVDRIRTNVRKIWLVKKREGNKILAWAGSGRLNYLDAIARAINNGIDPKTFLESLMPLVGPGSGINGNLLYITTEVPHRAYKISYEGRDVREEEITGKVTAIGSGTPAALGAHQWLGANAVEMVAMAIDSDIYSGGNVTSIYPLNEKAEVKRSTDPADIKKQLLERKLKPVEPEKPKRTRTTKKKEAAK